PCARSPGGRARPSRPAGSAAETPARRWPGNGRSRRRRRRGYWRCPDRRPGRKPMPCGGSLQRSSDADEVVLPQPERETTTDNTDSTDKRSSEAAPNLDHYSCRLLLPWPSVLSVLSVVLRLL